MVYHIEGSVSQARELPLSPCDQKSTSVSREIEQVASCQIKSSHPSKMLQSAWNSKVLQPLVISSFLVPFSPPSAFPILVLVSTVWVAYLLVPEILRRQKNESIITSTSTNLSKTFPSKLDKNIFVSRKRWAVTLIADKNTRHARLIFEGVDKSNEQWTIFVHLKGNSSGCKRILHECGGLVEMKDITDRDIIYRDRSSTWSISASSGRRVINYVQDFCDEYFDPEDIASVRNQKTINNDPKKVPFFIAGNQSKITSFFNRFVAREFHSCITFSLLLLRITGVSFRNPNGKLYTDTLNFLGEENAVYKRSKLQIMDLCWFIIYGDIESIIEHFPPNSINIDEIVYFCTDSQKERTKNISPLMLAILTKNHKLVKILIEKHNADVEFARDDGITPLFIARVVAKLSKEHPIVKCLITNGAHKYLKDPDGKSNNLNKKSLINDGIFGDDVWPVLREDDQEIQSLDKEIKKVYDDESVDDQTLLNLFKRREYLWQKQSQLGKIWSIVYTEKTEIDFSGNGFGL
ncbi:MAG: ankyrin repeat domain-containing protein (plasmid) [Candidatus Algichlamydia australiensis]|nr:ankyrin repeat domain-containing protein [Chlamydiales bacterium]